MEIINYKETEEQFFSFVERCRLLVLNCFFKESEL